jgi:BirA family biotin operon repressor/biotin-[acetyl-CoA-carboxylase] ligase
MGHSLVFMPECHSTNDEASRLIQNSNVLEGTVVITENQTSGRGQRGNTWFSEPGKNLTFSILIKPSFLTVKNQFSLNVAFSLGLFDYLTKALGAGVKVKWPNDIYVNGKKICGILIENHIQAQHIQHSIVGIGLNVNQRQHLVPTATSMNLENWKDYNLEEVLPKLLESLEKRFLQLRSQDFKKLNDDYLASLYWRGEQHLFKSKDNTFEGTILGIDETGKLEVETKVGTIQFDIKEIEFLK